MKLNTQRYTCTSWQEGFLSNWAHSTLLFFFFFFFCRIPVDQTIEETINRDTQTPGGAKGFSLKEGALHRYYLNAEYRTQYLRKLREMIGLSGLPLKHPDLQETGIKRDERDVQSLHNLIDQVLVNPFKDD